MTKNIKILKKINQKYIKITCGAVIPSFFQPIPDIYFFDFFFNIAHFKDMLCEEINFYSNLSWNFREKKKKNPVIIIKGLREIYIGHSFGVPRQKKKKIEDHCYRLSWNDLL